MNKWTRQRAINTEPGEPLKARIRQLIYYEGHGKSNAWIAKKLGYKHKMSITHLRSRKWYQQEVERLKDKLPCPVGKRWQPMTAAEIETIKELHAQGCNDSTIGKQIGYSRRSIGHRRHQLGLKAICPKPPKCTEVEIEEFIRLRIDERLTYRKIAEITGRDPRLISKRVRERAGEVLSATRNKQLMKDWEKITEAWETNAEEVA